MKAAARILVTAAALAALSTLGLTATATASVPPPDERPQHPTTVQEHATVPNSGHGAQYDRDAAAAPPAASQPGSDRDVAAPAGRQLVPVLTVTLASLLLALAGATWLRLRHRPREAI